MMPLRCVHERLQPARDGERGAGGRLANGYVLVVCWRCASRGVAWLAHLVPTSGFRFVFFAAPSI